MKRANENFDVLLSVCKECCRRSNFCSFVCFVLFSIVSSAGADQQVPAKLALHLSSLFRRHVAKLGRQFVAILFVRGNVVRKNVIFFDRQHFPLLVGQKFAPYTCLSVAVGNCRQNTNKSSHEN